MSTRVWLASALVYWFGATALPVGLSLADEEFATSKPAAAAVNPAQLQEIRAITQPQALVDLARRYFLLREPEAARLCIEKACLADPSVLADSKTVSPRSWRQFWFRNRMVIRLRKLSPGDAAGRVAIAVWLNEGSERGEARRMLRAALEINPELEAARSLAKTWKLDSGGPFRFDLTFALSQPLLLDSFADEGEKLELRPGRKFMLLPFAYDPAEGPLRILKSSVQVTADGAQRCRAAGIILLTVEASSPSGGAPGNSLVPTVLKLVDQPLWERIQVQRTDDGGLDLMASNVVRPPSKRTTVKSRDRSAVPQPSWPVLSQPPSGYAAFLVDVPESMNVMEAVYEDDVRVQLETRLLEILGRPITGMSPEEQGEFVSVLAEKVLASNPLVASAAVAKLSLVRQAMPAVAGEAASPGTPDRAEDPVARIDQTLWSALGNCDPTVRRKAFAAMVETDRPLGPTLLGALRDPTQESLTLVMLDQIEQVLTTASTSDQAGGGTAAGSVPGAVPSASAGLKLAGLEPSSAPANVFTVLSACLGSLHSAIVERVIDIILADGSEQAVLALLDLPMDGRTTLLDRLGRVKVPELKAALVRVLLMRPDPVILGKLLEVCRDLKPQISGPDDPLLNIFRARLPVGAQVELVGLLARSDLTAIADSQALENILATLAMDAQRNGPMQAALLELAKASFQESYQVPLGPIRRGGAAEEKASPFAGLLARLASAPGADFSIVRSAATVLLGAGHLQVLQEKLRQMPSAADRAKLIAGVGESKALWSREALPIFLASSLADNDPKPAAAALDALAEIYKATDAQSRWRLNLAIKLGIDPQALVRWTQAPDEKLARQAMSLLRQLSQMSQEESDQYEALQDPAGRQQFVMDLERRRVEKPAGKYACMVYVDLKPIASQRSPQEPSPTNQPAEESKPMRNIPLPSSPVTIQGEGDTITQIVSDNRQIGMPNERGVLISSPGQFQVDAAPLLLDGFRWAYEQKQPFAGKVDRLVLSERLKCELRHHRFGTWCGEVTLDTARQPNVSLPLQIVGGMIVLEPIGEPPSAPRAVEVQEK